MKNPRLFTLGAVVLAPALLAVLPMATANAHGYVSSPASRQAQCAQGTVSCGDISYEPQSVEGPKGLRDCSGGNAKFAELNDDSKGWKPQSVGRSASFTWTNTALHRTASWEYYIGDTRVGFVDGNNEPPGRTVTHAVDLGAFTGRQKLLAIWNIGDTANAFYACVDLQIDGSGTTTQPTTTTPAPTTTQPPTTTQAPSTSQAPTTTHNHTTTTSPQPTTPAADEWKVGATYAVGDTVTYQGGKYRCLQAHTVHDPGWTPPNTPALWQKL